LYKLAATQTLIQPFVYIPFFFLCHGLLLGQSLTEIGDEVSRKYFSVLLRLWTLFMPTRLLMFIIVPVKYQVLWDSSVSFVWQVVLSLFEAAPLKQDQGGVIAEVMDNQAFGYLVPREPGAQFLPPEHR
jgi:hypothetical protein